jgi:beta-mannanase
MPEMNCTEVYAIGHDGNTSAKFVAAWRHIVTIGRNVGATNVKWMWNPNRAFKGSYALKPMWPGRTWVDWVGIDGYNYGTKDHGGWLWFKELFRPTIRKIRSFAPGKPMMVAEVGCAASRYKAAWMKGMFGSAPSLGFKILVYFDYNMKRDWRFASSAASLSAAHAGVRMDGWITK